MLLCPQCPFENPNTNKFCQRCGTSLTHKSCHECGTQVPVNAATCHNCGEFTGTVWWAIIAKDLESFSPLTNAQAVPLEALESVTDNTYQTEVSPLQEPVDSEAKGHESTSSSPQMGVNPPDVESIPLSPVEPLEATANEEGSQTPSSLPSDLAEPVNNDNNHSEVASGTPTTVYLDPQQRYRLLEPLSLEQIAAAAETRYGTAVQVLDCQPFQQSPLEALLEQQPSEAQKLEGLGGKSANIHSDSWKALGIPAIAQPYLALKESYYPTLPEVHDAWQQDGQAVVLLEDRSEWTLLSDLWGNEQLSTLQILYWLGEIAELWEALEHWHCRQSLLEIENLRVDEDQVLGLVRLYPEPSEQQLTLQDLGQLWQQLFSQSQKTQFTSLGAVFRQLCTNEIKTVDELRSQLLAIAHEQQSSSPTVAQSPDSAWDESDSPMPINIADEGGTPMTMKSPFNNASDNDGDATVILPMQLLSLDDAGCTDIGQQREHNEDCFGIHTQVKKQESPMGRSVQAHGLYVLCDGMGGHAAGEVASAMAVETIKRYFQDNWQDQQLPTEDSVREAVLLANQAIYDVNQQNARSGNGRMGTTLAMVLIQNTNAMIAHVGDSRLYRLTRKRGLEQITVDHEVGQREMKRGVEQAIAYSRPDAYQLTQALGPRSEQFINPDVQFLELNEDTLFVLCSDGLSDNDFIETHWQSHLAPLLSSRAHLDQGILQLIELANKHNGHDNITAVLIRVKVRPNFDQQQLL
ncbi:MAG: serine/threonine phosphatase [Symplocastrum torsivum CPER-KK1]|uniref:Serine/threonine phosphatase n=1 Tax=Symplocastrum torsivum CPER-KK1 TaxID=450513 RepID=A0A951PIV4_9CYAN|nr:serine/threonine phosphatase [Symplocastrum torsivum CPER-KK1]